MDPLSHSLITRIAFGRDTGALVAGLAPDAPFYATYPLWVVSQGRFWRSFEEGAWPDAPAWMYPLHHAAHSLPTALTITALTWLRTGELPRWCLAWLVHILIDIPTHSRQYWAPQYLWPLSDQTVDGVSWPVAASALFRHARIRLLAKT